MSGSVDMEVEELEMVAVRSSDDSERRALLSKDDTSTEQPLASDDVDVDGDLEYPTEEEKQTLRRIPDTIPLAAFTIVIVELCERFAIVGLFGVVQNYLQNPLPPGGNGAGAPASVDDPYPAGALGLGQRTATALQNVFGFVLYIWPLVGAIVADTKWGRYKTICYGCVFYFVGLAIITATSFPASIKSGWALPGWAFGSLIVAVGAGGIKANVSPLIADQCSQTEAHVHRTVNGERVIVDPSLTVTRIYSLFYWTLQLGSTASAITTVIERRVGFWAAFLLPTCVFLATPTVLACSSRLYRKVPPRGSILVEVYCIISMVLDGFWKRPSQYIRATLALDELYTTQSRPGYTSLQPSPSPSPSPSLWDRAKPSHHLAVHSGPLPPDLTWSDAFVDSVHRTALACRVFLFYPLFWVAQGQMGTNLISMAGTMTTHSLPNDIVIQVNPISLIILIPILDVFVYPALGKVGVRLKPIFRIWMGFVLATLALAYCAVLQWYVYRTNPCGEFASSCVTPSSIHVFYQIPAYIIFALAEICGSITGLEYAYSQAPKSMKSVVMAIFMLSNAVGSILSAFVASLAVDPHLVRFYAGVALVTFVAGNGFYACFRHRDSDAESRHSEAGWSSM